MKWPPSFLDRWRPDPVEVPPPPAQVEPAWALAERLTTALHNANVLASHEPGFVASVRALVLRTLSQEAP